MQQHVMDADVIIAGGGMAGVCAAIAAARQGATVVLVQDRSVLGGNASSEVRMHVVGADCSGGRKGWRESGIIEELRLEDAYRNPERCYPFWDVLLYEKVIAEKNITLLLDTDVVGVEMDGAWGTLERPSRTERLYEFNGPRNARIKAVRAVRQLTQDEFILRGKMFCDCTGDGRLGFEAGADFRIGRESKSMHGETLATDADDVYTLGSSILFTSRKTDKPVPFVPPPWARKFDPDNIGVGRRINSWEYGFWWFEWGGQHDTIKDNCTKIRHELLAIALGAWDCVKNSGKYPDSANWVLDWIGAVPGKRESRRFIGHYMLTEQDILESRAHEDEVAMGGWAIDLHPVKGIDATTEPPFTPTRSQNVYGIPLRCYISRNVENLFMGGRLISATHVAFASTRVMATCSVGGQAIGTAAAWCARDQITPAQMIERRLPVRALQQELLKRDVTLPSVRAGRTAVHDGVLACSSEDKDASLNNLLDGWTRDEYGSAGRVLRHHGWHSAPLEPGKPQWVEVSWDEAVELREIHLTFDSGFGRPLMISPQASIVRRTVRGPQPETVKSYWIELDGKEVVRVDGNYQRHRTHTVPAGTRARSLRVVMTQTNGSAEARLFDLRVY